MTEAEIQQLIGKLVMTEFVLTRELQAALRPPGQGDDEMNNPDWAERMKIHEKAVAQQAANPPVHEKPADVLAMEAALAAAKNGK
jgi:hypothetical protein